MEIFNLGTTSAQPMQADYTIPMAIIDLLPVILFFLAAMIIAKDLYSKVSRTAYTLISSGIIMCLIGGVFKAAWKILFICGINYPIFNTALFLMQAPGFCLYFVGLIFALKETKSVLVSNNNKDNESKDTLKIVSATTVTTSVPMIGFQTIGSIGSLICLSILSKRMKKPSAIVCFVLSIVLLLTMGYLGATLDSSLAWTNWAAQCINTLAQLMFYIGVRILHKNGLADKNFGKEE